MFGDQPSKMSRPGAWCVLVVVAASLTRSVESSHQVIKDMSENFGKALEVCKAEMNLPDTIYTDFINFWKEDHVVTNRDTGCAVLCLSRKLELVDPDGKLHHGNAKGFALKHGADENLATDLVNIIHSCEQGLPPFDDPCLKVVDWIMCFKAEIHKKGMAPPIDVAVSEILAEV